MSTPKSSPTEVSSERERRIWDSGFNTALAKFRHDADEHYYLGVFVGFVSGVVLTLSIYYLFWRHP